MKGLDADEVKWGQLLDRIDVNKDGKVLLVIRVD
jgi:hypothetical protein